MKKTPEKKQLKLNPERVRDLTSEQLAKVDGGFVPSGHITCDNCVVPC